MLTPKNKGQYTVEEMIEFYTLFNDRCLSEKFGTGYLTVHSGATLSRSKAAGYINTHNIKRTRIINGIVVAAPLTVTPERGVRVWDVSLSNIDGCTSWTWDWDETDWTSLNNGVLFASKEDAQENTRAIASITKVKQDE